MFFCKFLFLLLFEIYSSFTEKIVLYLIYYISKYDIIKSLLFRAYKLQLCCLSACLPTYLPTYIPIYLPTYIPTYIPIYLPIYLPTYLHTYLHTYLPTYIPTYLHTSLPIYLPIYLPTYLPTNLLGSTLSSYPYIVSYPYQFYMYVCTTVRLNKITNIFYVEPHQFLFSP